VQQRGPWDENINRLYHTLFGIDFIQETSNGGAWPELKPVETFHASLQLRTALETSCNTELTFRNVVFVEHDEAEKIQRCCWKTYWQEVLSKPLPEIQLDLQEEVKKQEKLELEMKAKGK
jgi:hypothetical protein